MHELLNLSAMRITTSVKVTPFPSKLLTTYTETGSIGPLSVQKARNVQGSVFCQEIGSGSFASLCVENNGSDWDFQVEEEFHRQDSYTPATVQPSITTSAVLLLSCLTLAD